MAGASQGFHEAEEKLSPETKDAHRALVSLQEELEAIDWYRQRADATENASLKAVLLHNMGEEVEHACMLLEWFRWRSSSSSPYSTSSFWFRPRSSWSRKGRWKK